MERVRQDHNSGWHRGVMTQNGFVFTAKAQGRQTGMWLHTAEAELALCTELQTKGTSKPKIFAPLPSAWVAYSRDTQEWLRLSGGHSRKR